MDLMSNNDGFWPSNRSQSGLSLQLGRRLFSQGASYSIPRPGTQVSFELPFPNRKWRFAPWKWRFFPWKMPICVPAGAGFPANVKTTNVGGGKVSTRGSGRSTANWSIEIDAFWVLFSIEKAAISMEIRSKKKHKPFDMTLNFWNISERSCGCDYVIFNWRMLILCWKLMLFHRRMMLCRGCVFSARLTSTFNFCVIFLRDLATAVFSAGLTSL